MPEDLERKRARDLARYHHRRKTGTWTHSTAQTPEQLAKKKERQDRALAWREVGRAFERFRRLPEDVQTRVLKEARA